MDAYRPEDIAACVGGELLNGSQGPVTGVSIDSRRTQPGDLFVAITTQTNDGHQYLPAAFACGAKAALVSRRQAQIHLRDWDIFTLIAVDDPVAALQCWAQAHRRRFSVPVIAITGSNGKTTTKEFVAAALSHLGPILRTEGTLNNHLGVPVTLLGLTAEHRAAVVEMGMNHAGEIRVLGQMAEPTMGIIMNTGQAHLEFFPSLDALVNAKWELAATMVGERLLVLNCDDAGLRARGAHYDGPIRWFGLETSCEWHPTEIEQSGDGRWRFRVRDAVVDLQVPGRHMVGNALAALAAADALRVPLAEAARRISATSSSERRMRSLWLGGILVLDDAYNANPSSMEAALHTLMTLQPEDGGRRIAVLGGMRELGGMSVALHRHVGRIAAQLVVVAVGELAADIAAGARDVEGATVIEFETHEEASAWLAEHLRPGDVVLVKGSRSERMERVIDALRERLEQPAAGQGRPENEGERARVEMA